jgi:hypothetical protein
MTMSAEAVADSTLLCMYLAGYLATIVAYAWASYMNGNNFYLAARHPPLLWIDLAANAFISTVFGKCLDDALAPLVILAQQGLSGTVWSHPWQAADTAYLVLWQVSTVVLPSSALKQIWLDTGRGGFPLMVSDLASLLTYFSFFPVHLLKASAHAAGHCIGRAALLVTY